MENCTIALFGEAERGVYCTAYFCQSLFQLEENLGSPPLHTQGLYFAIQALLFHRDLIFFRVREEGFSQLDYMVGLRFLQIQETIPKISAIGIPGVGDLKLIDAVTPLCQAKHSILLMSESDLYDYLTVSAG